MRQLSLVALLLCVAPPLLLLWCVLSPPLQSYHPFHPNHSHLPSSYLHSTAALSRHSPSYLLSSALTPHSSIEGWYLKLRTASGRHFAIIYLYFVSSDPANSTAAITLLDAQNEQSHLFKYPLEHFHSSPLPSAAQSLSFLRHSTAATADSPSPYHDFELRVGNNSMSPYAVTAQLSAAGQSEAWVSAEVDMTLSRTVDASRALLPRHGAHWWSALFSPATHTVGLFAFLPLACYQQVIELQLAVSGQLTLDGERIDLTGATAYYEKTRGSTFPDNYLWIHAAHFKRADTDGAGHSDSPSSLSSFFFSLASVPILPLSLRLPGFVCSFVLDGQTSHFATQLGSVLASLRIDDRAVQFVLYDQHFTTRVAVNVSRPGGPVAADSWLWAARNEQLSRVIPQRIGLDAVHVTVERVVAPTEQWKQRPHSSDDDTAERSSTAERAGPALDAQSFLARGYSFSPVLAATSGSVGLEVFVHESELQRQVATLYSEVRPWLSDRYFALDTPLVSFSLSNAFLRFVLPEAASGVTDRLPIAHVLLAVTASIIVVLAASVYVLMACARRTARKLKLKTD